MRSLLMLALLVLSGAASAALPSGVHILVDKSRRTLMVYADKVVIATYPVVFGGNPVGHKAREGDRRTPEGNYMLDHKNPNSAYHRSIHVSYPDPADRADARRRGVSPGGDIMIHGQPNNPKFRRYLDEHPGVDWTDGCIALSNKDMDALWAQISVPVRIEITP